MTDSVYGIRQTCIDGLSARLLQLHLISCLFNVFFVESRRSHNSTSGGSTLSAYCRIALSLAHASAGFTGVAHPCQFLRLGAFRLSLGGV